MINIKRKMEDQRADAARKKAEARPELDVQIIEDAEGLVAAWNEGSRSVTPQQMP